MLMGGALGPDGLGTIPARVGEFDPGVCKPHLRPDQRLDLPLLQFLPVSFQFI